MKKLLLLAMLLIGAWANNFAQNLIAVQNSGTPTFFQQVDDAILSSQDGDTIFLPGGTWNISQPINKRLHIIGVGHNPDSTSATFPSTLQGYFVLALGASNGSLNGIFLNGSFSTNDSVSSYTVFRCNIIGAIYANPGIDNFTFIENILQGGLIGEQTGAPNYGYASNCSFFNNIINGATNMYGRRIPFINSVYKNNAFIGYSWVDNSGAAFNIASQYSVFENNIFFNTLGFGVVYNSTANNNLFVESISFPIGTNVGSNNIAGQEQSTIFINNSGSRFPYDYNLHLQSNSPGKNAGTDGTDIGIYGGLYPWKEGSLPSNPHIQFKNISGSTDQNGNLNVNIKVAAQDH
jgi:hypothetical protein